MNPDAAKLWRGPRWALALMIAALGSVGPFSIDTYLPAFAGIAADVRATPVQMQQTLSAYLFGFAFMNLFHGALSDSVGRRPVVLWGVGVFALASTGCALSTHVGALIAFRALQGLSAGAGVVVSRAIVRDMFAPVEAQRVMSQVTIYFGVAPAIAPIIGGWLFVHAGWHAVFWFLAAIGLVLWTAIWRWLPESLHPSQAQPFNARDLMRGYVQLGSSPRFLLLALASGIPFNGMFLYVLSAPAFLGDVLGLAPTQFFWFFLISIAGIMAGALASGRLAGRIERRVQVRWGFRIMVASALVNLAANAAFEPHASWAMLPIAGYSFGWSLMVPVVTLMVLDLFPERRGMASSLQATIGSLANGLVAGAIAPLVMHSALGLSVASIALMSIGLVAWRIVRTRWPQSGIDPPAAP
ncbi:MAG: multidrug effflux MFS transporter [Burkholderiaceae bacterium]|nr:multidrug effflux MFS transporter [Burkholderiales bacterium]MCZ8106132.1 multidrug effflux MFS transporter [Burkholderiales bacterium]MCZ8340292.1 multidrug effflux MFS transporter [Burkholderiaceae bacterium]